MSTNKPEQRQFQAIGSKAGEMLEAEMAIAESIPAQEIEAYADLIIEEVLPHMSEIKSSKIQYLYFINALRDDSIVRIYEDAIREHGDISVRYDDIVTTNDKQMLARTTQRIRERILQKIFEATDKEETMMYVTRLKKDLFGQGAPSPFLMQSVNNRDFVFRPSEHSSNPDVYKNYKQAMETYASLDAHPSLIPVRYIQDSGTRVQMIVESVGFSTLEECVEDLALENDLDEEEQHRISNSLLHAFVDCIKASEYLEQNGLIMTDTKLDNLGIVTDPNDKRYGKGLLFDLDGLRTLGAKTLRSWTETYVPPEIDTSPELEEDEFYIPIGDDNDSKDSDLGRRVKKNIPTNSAESVYQLGLSLGYMLVMRNVECPKKQDLIALADKMASVSPTERPSLTQAREALEQLI